MKFTTINGYRKTNYRRTNASVPVLAQGLLNDVVDSVLKEVSNWVTGREVSDTTLLSAVRVRRTVRRFSQFYRHRRDNV